MINSNADMIIKERCITKMPIICMTPSNSDERFEILIGIVILWIGLNNNCIALDEEKIIKPQFWNTNPYTLKEHFGVSYQKRSNSNLGLKKEQIGFKIFKRVEPNSWNRMKMVIKNCWNYGWSYVIWKYTGSSPSQAGSEALLKVVFLFRYSLGSGFICRLGKGSRPESYGYW